jgi:hypothetical protein
MSRMTTAGRRGIVAAFAATIITTAACGTETATDVEDPGPTTPYAPGAVAPQLAPHAPTSADSAERRGAAQGPLSADSAERQGASQELMPSDPAQRQPSPPGMRVPD